MAVTLRDEDVQALKTALVNGQQEVDGVLEALHGTAVERIHQGLEGTQTATAFDEKITELIQQLRETLPAFEALGTFVTSYLEQFHATDQEQASALRG